MPYYASFCDLQKELTGYYQSTGLRLQFEEAIASLRRQGKLKQFPPSLSQEPSEVEGAAFVRHVDRMWFPVPPVHATPERVEEKRFFTVQRDVFIFRHPRYTRPLLHLHDFWEVAFVTRGSCQLHFESEVHTLKQGCVFLIAPGSMHDIEITDDSIVYCIMLRRSTFEATFFPLMSRDDALSLFFLNNLKKTDSAPNYLLFRASCTPEIETILGRALLECYRDDSYANSCAVNYINLFFATLLRSVGDSPDFYRYQAGADFSQILHTIRHQYRTLTLAELADQFHYSKPHLCTLIKQNTGVSYTELIRQIRMSRATQYLLNTELPIAEIAEIIGYHSADHFSRVFRGSFGCSPQEYRRTHVKDGEIFVPSEMQQESPPAD